MIVQSTVAPELSGAHLAGPTTTQALLQEPMPMSVTQRQPPGSLCLFAASYHRPAHASIMRLSTSRQVMSQRHGHILFHHLVCPCMRAYLIATWLLLDGSYHGYQSIIQSIAQSKSTKACSSRLGLRSCTQFVLLAAVLPCVTNSNRQAAAVSFHCS